MIHDYLSNYKQYEYIHPAFGRAFQFLVDNIGEINDGVYEIDGNDLFVTFVETELRPANEAPLEAHREYIDIQLIISGIEQFAWTPLKDCNRPTEPFNHDKDIIFFSDPHSSLLTVESGSFVIFFPEDAHAPLIGEGDVRKAIVKVRIANNIQNR